MALWLHAGEVPVCLQCGSSHVAATRRNHSDVSCQRCGYLGIPLRLPVEDVPPEHVRWDAA